MNVRAPQLSIIIPAYNEEQRLPRTLARIREYFGESHIAPEDLEIIVVDDGSTDKTLQIARALTDEIPQLRCISNPGNRGKGYSVKHGMLEARGEVGLFTDADLSSPIEECQKLFEAIEAGNDIAVGSRALDRSLIATHQSRFREVAGMIFNGFVRLFTGLPIYDTQCGFKAFDLSVSRKIFQEQRVDDFGFDPEILFLAKKYGLRIAEVPVRWAHDEGTKVHMLRDSALMLAGLVRMRWNWFRGLYRRYPASEQS